MGTYPAWEPAVDAPATTLLSLFRLGDKPRRDGDVWIGC